MKALALLENISGSRSGGWENSLDRSVCWEKLVGALESNDRGTCDLTKTVGAPMSVAYIWSVLTLVETYHGAGAEICGGRKGLLTQYQSLLEIFGQSSCRFRMFGLGLTSVEEVDALIGVPGEDMPCGYVGSR